MKNTAIKVSHRLSNPLLIIAKKTTSLVERRLYHPPLAGAAILSAITAMQEYQQ